MNDDISHQMTPFDEYICNQSLQMMKLMIPFLPPQNQRMFAIYIKFQELQYTLSSFRRMRQCHRTPEDILHTLKPYLSSADLESFEQMQNMMEMMSMMQEMQEMQDEHDHSQKEGETND